MRRAPRKKQQKRLLRPRAAAEVITSVACLGDGVVTGPLQFIRSVGIVERVRVIVGAFERFPVVEALTPFVRDKGRSPVSVQMPLANVTRVIALQLEDPGHA